MRALFLIFSVLVATQSRSQQNLQLFDISQTQLRLMRQYKDADSLTRTKVFLDSIYTPYQEFWNGYMGDGENLTEWMNKAIKILPQFEKRNANVDGERLIGQFREVAKNMKQLTGYNPKGKWYIVYGPGWTDMGGLGDFAMLIDLSHRSNSSNDQIVRTFPHELTHQIMTNVNKHHDTSAITPIIGEGFAVWMNQLYWKDKYTLAQNLGYTPEELKLCDDSIATVRKYFSVNKYSTDKSVIDFFRNRSAHLNDKFPGAIGYYIGFKIVDAYVKKNGKDSWKDIFKKSPKEIYEKSGFES